MTKKIIIILFFQFNLFVSSSTFSQSYETESKSCGSCHRAVSIDSRVGMYCPHCGVRWGYENETKKNSSNFNYNYNSYEKTVGLTTASVNLRSGPSTKSEIIKITTDNFNNLFFN